MQSSTMMRRLLLRSYTFDANAPSASIGSAAVTPIRNQRSTESSQDAPAHNASHHGHRSSSQPAAPRDHSFNEISDGNWTYCIASQNTAPAVTGFGNVPIVSYEEIEKMGDRRLKLCAVTWNVNEKNSKVLNHLSRKFIEKSSELDSDIIFISLQEIPSTSTTFHEDALKILEPVFRGHSLYFTHRAWSQMVIVFIRQKHLRFAIQPQASFIPSGAMAKPVRTKGAIAVCLRLYQRFIVLIGCHLSHATPAQRIQDYAKVVRVLRYPSLAKFHAHENSDMFSSDLVLWTGDLNFRVTVENTVDWRSNVSNEMYDKVLKTEELAQHTEGRTAFVGFREAPVRFPPTHKFEPDTDDYVPKRIPSFTDRVLYWVSNTEWITNIQYDSLRGACGSDHKPVYATFWLTVINKPVPESYRQQRLAAQQSSSVENGSTA